MEVAYVKKRMANALMPEADRCAFEGYVVHAIKHFRVKSGQEAWIDTGLSIKPPAGTYARLTEVSQLNGRSGLRILSDSLPLEGLDSMLQVHVFNSTYSDIPVRQKQPIARVVFECFKQATFQEVDTLPGESQDQTGTPDSIDVTAEMLKNVGFKPRTSTVWNLRLQQGE